jgi:cytidylate kinase
MSGMALGFQQRAAEERVRERDRAAAAYLRRFYDVDWNDRNLYHPVIDTAK